MILHHLDFTRQGGTLNLVPGRFMIFDCLSILDAHPRSTWDIHGKSGDEIGDQFALFALGSLANMATLNPSIQIPGNLSHLGHSVTVYEPWFSILWTCIVGTHLAVFATIAIWTR